MNTAFEQTTPEIAEKVLAATVSLEMQDATGTPVRHGSGFCIQQNLIATNYHVIQDTVLGTAKLVGQEISEKHPIEGVVATDEANDLALLKITVPGVKQLVLGDSENVRIGETIYVCGNPKGLEGTFSDGIISSIRRGAADTHFQMTAPISPGSSGGPVVNARGEVIGVSSRIMEAGQNLNFAIPSEFLRQLLEDAGPVRTLSSASSGISAETYLEQGNQKEELGDYAGAVDDYNMAIHIDPNNADAYRSRAYAKRELGEYSATIADYDAAIRIKPDDRYAYSSRGLAKYYLGEYSAAIADYDAAIRIKPDDDYAYFFRGNVKRQLGEYSAAIADYDAAIHIKPDFATAYYIRGNVKAHLNRETEAMQDLYTARGIADKLGDADLKASIDEALDDLDN